MSPHSKTTNAHNSFKDILGLDLSACEIHLCLASVGNEDEPDFQKVAISQAVANEFRHIIARQLERKKKDIEAGDLVIRQYDPATKPDSHEVEHLDLATHTAIREQILELINLQTLSTFAQDPDFISTLRFYVIVLRPPSDAPIFCFRIYSPKKELSRSALFAIVFRNGHYDRMEEPLFLFDQYLDCLVQGNDLFIFNKDKFQKIFRFYEMLVKTAKETLAIIRKRIPIDDFDAFEKACEGHLQKIAKLKNIASKPYLAQLTMADLKKVINKYDLPVKTVGKGKKEKIHFDASDKWAILRLLDDDYLESVMTGNSYEANSKRPL